MVYFGHRNTRNCITLQNNTVKLLNSELTIKLFFRWHVYYILNVISSTVTSSVSLLPVDV